MLQITAEKLDFHMPIADPLIYLTKIAQRSNISGQIQSDAAKIINVAKSMHASAGKDPMGLAAAALYIACKQAGEKKTQKDIADAAGVTEVTVRNRFKNLKRQLRLELPD